MSERNPPSFARSLDEQSSMKPRRVLVVEDHDEIRESVALALELEGFEVRSAPDGQVALSVLEEWQPCVIVLDLMMPRMDGWAFRKRQLQMQNASDVPVVVLTAARQTAEDAQALRAHSVVPKPFEIDTLMRAVNACC